MHRQRLLAVGFAVLLVLSGCSGLDGSLLASGDPAGPITFENATSEAGLDYRGSGTGIGAGNNAVYAGDVTNDGWTDLLAMGGEQPALFVNREGEFDRRDSFPEISATLKSATFVDYDDDGWEDVILFPVRGAPIALHNDEGEFERLDSDLGLGNLTYPLGATVADYDGDGDRDLFVYQSGDWSEHNPAGYYSLNQSVQDDNGYPNVLYENTGEDGDDRFERVTDAGIEGDRWSLAASFVDLTDDGNPDIHVANDYNNDTLYVNRGDGTFERRVLGGRTARNGMASEVADVNGDGLQDVFVTNIYIPLRQNNDNIPDERYDRISRLFDFVVKSERAKGNSLLINQGDGTFEERADEYNVRKGGWGWSASFTDFNNDGRQDLIHATQKIVRLDPENPRWTLAQVWSRNDSSFSRVNRSVHGIAEHNARGMTTLDYDHDGTRDVVVADYGGPLTLYENTGDEGNSVQFEVVDEDGATALGASVDVAFDGGSQTVVQTDDNGFFAQEARARHVGLGDAESATLTVTWPDGTEQEYEVDANRRVLISKDGVEVVTDYSG